MLVQSKVSHVHLPRVFPVPQTPGGTPFMYSVYLIVQIVGRCHVYAVERVLPLVNCNYPTVVSSGPPVVALVKGAEQEQGVVKVNAGARLVMERASFSMG